MQTRLCSFRATLCVLPAVSDSDSDESDSNDDRRRRQDNDNDNDNDEEEEKEEADTPDMNQRETIQRQQIRPMPAGAGVRAQTGGQTVFTYNEQVIIGYVHTCTLKRYIQSNAMSL